MTPAISFHYGEEGCNTFYVRDDTCYSQNVCTCDERLPEIAQRNLVLTDLCSGEVLAAGVAQQVCVALDAESTQIIKGQTYTLSLGDCSYSVLVGDGIVPSLGLPATASFQVNSVTGIGFTLANVLIGGINLGTSALITPTNVANAATLIAVQLNALATSASAEGKVSAKAIGATVTVTVDANWYFAQQGSSINGLSLTFDAVTEAAFGDMPAAFSGGVYANTDANKENALAILNNLAAQITQDDGCSRKVKVVAQPSSICPSDDDCLLLIEAYWPGEPFDYGVQFSPAAGESATFTVTEVRASATNWDPVTLTAAYKRLYSIANDQDRIVFARMMVDLPSQTTDTIDRMVVEKRGAILCKLQDARDQALLAEAKQCCDGNSCPPKSTQLSLYIEAIERALCNTETVCDVCPILELAQAYRNESICHEC